VTPLFPKDYWYRFGRKENSKNPAKDETNQRVEKVSAKSEKMKLSTQTRGEPADSAEIADRTAKTAKTAEPHLISVNDSNKFKSRETEKNRISARLIDRDVVESEDGRKVIIEVYDTGQVEEKVTGDKVIGVRKIKFALRYKNTVKECIDDCRDAVKEISKITRSHPPAKEIMAKINELKEEYATPEEISIVDYVRQKYPDRLAEIEKDPFGWMLQRTKEIVGYERLKLLTFLSIVSSQMERVTGMSRIHIMLVGKSGAGKSSTVKSVTRYIDGTDTYIAGTRLTQNSLGYINVDSFDGKVLFIEQIDRQNINYIREMMTEEKVCTLVTEKVTNADGNERLESHLRCTPGQSAVITTSVVDDIDVNKEQIFNRFLKVYVSPDALNADRVTEAIWTRRKNDINQVDRLVFMAYVLSRPKFADNSDLLDRAKKFLAPLKGVTREPLNRTIEVLRNLVIATAIARGKTKADDDDFNFVMQNFQLDILYNGLGLTEGDVGLISVMPDNNATLKTSAIADKLRVSKPYALGVLKNLERKGIVEGEKTDGKTFDWRLTDLGLRIKALVNNLDQDVVEVRDEKGELVGVADGKFRPDINAGNDRENAMSGNDGKEMQRSDDKDDRIIKAYDFLKRRGWTPLTDLSVVYGDDVIEKLKQKDLVTFNIIGDIEYVNAK